MKSNLKELIENNVLSEVEIIDFLSTLRKLSRYEVIDPRNFKMVLKHFGMKRRRGWIRVSKGIKYKLN
jgi:hypothetical protein